MANNNTSTKKIILVGATGTGKSTLVEKIISKVKNKAIFDPNDEYEGGLFFRDIEDFLKHALTLKNTLIVFEEATLFFTSRSNVKEVRELLVSCRHDNNSIIFVFHSLDQVPDAIKSLCDTMILFYTSDYVSKVKRKFSHDTNVISAFMKLKKEGKKPGNYVQIKL